ncbi:MAG TPA: hypothetical protein VJN21_06995 [Candidatus Acidoferrales bacterium]|nr:hypothetical protein [Candidatus Acidoferrales bacterium]
MAEVSEKDYCCTTAGSLCCWGCGFAVFYAAELAAIYSFHLGSCRPVALFAALGLARIWSEVSTDLEWEISD